MRRRKSKGCNDPEKTKQYNVDALSQRQSWCYGPHRSHSSQDYRKRQWQTPEVLRFFLAVQLCILCAVTLCAHYERFSVQSWLLFVDSYFSVLSSWTIYRQNFGNFTIPVPIPANIQLLLVSYNHCCCQCGRLFN